VIAQHVREGRRALAVCTANEGAGCTFIATNLAIAMAQNHHIAVITQRIPHESDFTGSRCFNSCILRGGNDHPFICNAFALHAEAAGDGAVHRPLPA
jgi:hypothetical protein